MTTRADLPTDPAAAHAAVTDLLTKLKVEEQLLLLLKGEILREMVGTAWGGQTRAGQALGVSGVQVWRLLGEDLLRRVHAALAAAGFGRGDYDARLAKGVVLLRLRDGREYPSDSPDWREDDPDDAERERSARKAGWIARMNAAGAVLDALHAAGLTASHDGLAADVGESGPRHALARGLAITVSL